MFIYSSTGSKWLWIVQLTVLSRCALSSNYHLYFNCLDLLWLYVCYLIFGIDLVNFCFPWKVGNYACPCSLTALSIYIWINFDKYQSIEGRGDFARLPCHQKHHLTRKKRRAIHLWYKISVHNLFHELGLASSWHEPKSHTTRLHWRLVCATEFDTDNMFNDDSLHILLLFPLRVRWHVWIPCMTTSSWIKNRWKIRF